MIVGVFVIDTYVVDFFHVIVYLLLKLSNFYIFLLAIERGFQYTKNYFIWILHAQIIKDKKIEGGSKIVSLVEVEID